MQPADLAALQQEKAARTAAQAKLDSQIVLAVKKARGEAPFDQPTRLQPNLTIRADGSVLVDIDGAVSPELLRQIEASGGKVLSSLAGAHAIRATVPISKMESLAGRADIRFIAPAVEAATNQAAPRGLP